MMVKSWGDDGGEGDQRGDRGMVKSWVKHSYTKDKNNLFLRKKHAFLKSLP